MRLRCPAQRRQPYSARSGALRQKGLCSHSSPLWGPLDGMGYVATSIFSAYSGSGYEGIPPHFGNPEPWVSKRTFGLVFFRGISQAKWLNTGGSFCGCSPHPNASALCEVSIEHRQCQCAMCGSFRSGDDLEGVTKLHTTPSSPSAPYFRGHFPGPSTMLRPPHPTGAPCPNSRPPPSRPPKVFAPDWGLEFEQATPPRPHPPRRQRCLL